MRDDFPASIRRVLGQRVGYVCSNPACSAQTIGPHTVPTKASCVGKAAHIHAASPRGPRYDGSQTQESRKSIANGVWLCARCADLIDTDESRYPAPLLHEWKARREAHTLNLLQVPSRATDGAAMIRVLAQELIDNAFDALAQHENATRITWRELDDVSLEKARRAIERASILAPDEPKLLIVRAAYLVAIGFPDKALEVLDSPQPEEHSLRRAMRARCLTELGRLEEAVQLLMAEAKSEAATPTTYYNLGLAQVRSDISAAQQSFEEALARDPQYAEAHLMLARVFLEQHQGERAASHLKLAFALKPSDSGIAVAYCRYLLDAGILQMAEPILLSLVTRAAVAADAWALLGEVHGRRGDFENSNEALLKALALDRFNVTALNNRMVLLMQSGKLAELIEFLRDFPLDESSIPDAFRTLIRQVRQHVDEQGLSEDSLLATSKFRHGSTSEADVTRILLNGARGIPPDVAASRYVVGDVAYPGDDDGLQGYCVVFIAALSPMADEFPLTQVRLVTESGRIELPLLCSRTTLLTEDREEIAHRLGQAQV